MSPTFEEYQREKGEREWNDRVRKRKEAMANAERVQKATEWKHIGNEKVKAGNFFEARDYYREAIIFVEDLVEARRKERNELLVPLYCNLAQVHLKLAENAAAEVAAGKALEIAEVPRNNIAAPFRTKAHFRRGLARRALGKLEEARDDFASALQLQPGCEDVASNLAEVRRAIAEQNREARKEMGGFLNRKATERREHEDRQRRQREKERLAEERRLERRARAEQRQQMQDAFKKLSEGKMLYEEREKDMEPVRKKEEEKRRTLELEQNLLNILDDAKGLPKTTDFDEFMDKKVARCEEQSSELDQKKKILDKKKKEQQWEEDNAWKGQRDEHRQRLEAERQAGLLEPGPKTLWQAKEVSRWCEQRLRDVLMGAFLDSDPLEPQVAARAMGNTADDSGTYVLKALITDVLKLVGDAAVMRLNPNKPVLHYFDYFLKLEWEVAIARPGINPYRTADQLIQVAADRDDGKAPPSITEHRISTGTFKVKELCSEDAPPDGTWPLATKVKKTCAESDEELLGAAEQLREKLKGQVEHLLSCWADEYRTHWN